MANGLYGMQEIRIDVRDQNVTKVYVYIDADMNCPHTIQGWHYKEYPASLSSTEIMSMLGKSQENDPIFWPHQWPEARTYMDCGEMFSTVIQSGEAPKLVHEHLSPEMKQFLSEGLGTPFEDNKQGE